MNVKVIRVQADIRVKKELLHEACEQLSNDFYRFSDPTFFVTLSKVRMLQAELDELHEVLKRLNSSQQVDPGFAS